jgi:hypothetical protein
VDLLIINQVVDLVVLDLVVLAGLVPEGTLQELQTIVGATPAALAAMVVREDWVDLVILEESSAVAAAVEVVVPGEVVAVAAVATNLEMLEIPEIQEVTEQTDLELDLVSTMVKMELEVDKVLMVKTEIPEMLWRLELERQQIPKQVSLLQLLVVRHMQSMLLLADS